MEAEAIPAHADPLVILPGLMCDARAWWHQIIGLSGARSILVGHYGEAESIEDMATLILSKAPPRFAVAGHWLGALVAMEMLRVAPERIARAAFLGVNPLPDTPQQSAARELRIVQAKAGRLTDTILEEYPAECLARGPERDYVQAMTLDMADALGADAFLRQSRALMRRPDPQKTLRKMRQRVLVVCGAHDTICPVRRHEIMAELIPDAKFLPVENAGHFPTLEQPEVATAALRDWLGEPTGRK